MDTQDYMELEDQFGVQNYAPLDIVLNRGENVWVWDVEGNKYIDMLSAYSAVNQGHCHPKIVRALIDQAQTLPLTSRAFRNDRLGPYLEKLCRSEEHTSELQSHSFISYAVFCLKKKK